MAEFLSIGGVLAASPEAQIRAVGGDAQAACALTSFKASVAYVLRVKLVAQPVLASWSAVLDYLRVMMAFKSTEQVRVLHLNTRNMLIRDEVMNEGSIDEAAVHVREIMRRALEVGSAAIILVHNHPSDDPEPSRADIDITRKVAEAGKRLGVSLHDHVIVATSGYSSFRALDFYDLPLERTRQHASSPRSRFGNCCELGCWRPSARTAGRAAWNEDDRQASAETFWRLMQLVQEREEQAAAAASLPRIIPLDN